MEIPHDDRDYLETICRTTTIQVQIMNSARIILLKDDGENIDDIAENFDMYQNSVMQYLKK